MKVLVAGANGKIGQRLVKQLAQSKHSVRAMIRNPDQADKLQTLGADTVVADLEDDCSEALAGCDAVIFTAGSGPDTGPDKTIDVDQNGAISLMDQARAAGAQRFLIVSSMRAEEPEAGPEKIQHYLRAKKNADDYLRQSGLDFTIVRPGKLTENAGTGKVQMAERVEEFGEIPREDVAAVLLESLSADNTVGLSFDVIAGETPVDVAVGELAPAR